MAVERITAEVRALQQAAAVVTAFGGKVEWPSLAEHIDALDVSLAAEPVCRDPADLELRTALGLKVA